MKNLATAIENARLFQQVEEELEKVKKDLGRYIRAISREHRPFYTKFRILPTSVLPFLLLVTNQFVGQILTLQSDFPL